MVGVLFVCLGNICRSPMAEAVFRRKVEEEGLEDRINVDSAGTGLWHVGEPAHLGTRRVLERHGIPYSGRARVLRPVDLHRFDYVVAMDEQNRRDILRLGRGKAEIVRLMDYAPHSTVKEVPDPYFDGQFDRVFGLVSEACSGLLAAIREEHAL